MYKKFLAKFKRENVIIKYIVPNKLLLFVAFLGLFGFIPITAEMEVNKFTIVSLIVGAIWILFWVIVWFRYIRYITKFNKK